MVRFWAVDEFLNGKCKQQMVFGIKNSPYFQVNLLNFL
jgi:hypothetical protein